MRGSKKMSFRPLSRNPEKKIKRKMFEIFFCLFWLFGFRIEYGMTIFFFLFVFISRFSA